MALVVALDVKVVIVLDTLHFVRYEKLLNFFDLAVVFPCGFISFAVFEVIVGQAFESGFAFGFGLFFS